MKIPALLILFISIHAYSCQELIGTYKSVSETEWNFELTISTDDVLLKYTEHVHGQRDLTTDIQVLSHGLCEKNEKGYHLIFAQQSISIEYNKMLSHKSFGGNGSSPGISGEFIEGQKIELWQGI